MYYYTNLESDKKNCIHLFRYTINRELHFVSDRESHIVSDRESLFFCLRQRVTYCFRQRVTFFVSDRESLFLYQTESHFIGPRVKNILVVKNILGHFFKNFFARALGI